MSEPMLTIYNHHTAACGIPPAVSNEPTELYIGDFANRDGEQWIFTFIARRTRRSSGAGTPTGNARAPSTTDGSTG